MSVSNLPFVDGILRLSANYAPGASFGLTLAAQFDATAIRFALEWYRTGGGMNLMRDVVVY